MVNNCAYTQVNGRRSSWAAPIFLLVSKYQTSWFFYLVYSFKTLPFAPIMSLLPHLQLFTFCLALSQLRFVASHQESGDWHCEPDAEAGIVAEFRPGFVTLDGHADDWADIDGFDFPLRPALDPDEDKEYKAGKMTVKVSLLIVENKIQTI